MNPVLEAALKKEERLVLIERRIAALERRLAMLEETHEY